MKRSYQKEVKIILNESSHARNFEREKLIHDYEYDQAISFIDSMIPDEITKSPDKYLHNTITIFGTRGSGKTSFLLSLSNKYKTHEKLEVLRIIDPTLIEDKGHVFLNVIAAIREIVFKKLDDLTDNDSTRETKKRWRASMMLLAAGLPSIDGMANNTDESWQEPEYVLDKGLVSVGSALNLADNFNSFLKESLSILKKTSFLLIFDDIDVDATKGWAVLETIRKYFTTSQLITVLSGDLKLYSLVIRQKKWSNFGNEILNFEGIHLNKLQYFNDMVTELEAQYLQKIMQPRYRIHLLSLQEKKQINRLPKIQIINNENGNKTEIQDLYDKIFAQFGIRNPAESEVFKTFILSQPFRMQIQFSTIMSTFLNSQDLRENSEKITDIFLSDLLEQDINVNLANSTSKFLTSIILRLLLKRSQLKDLYQLQPSTVDNSLNACLTTLNFLLSKSLLESSFYISFDYLIKIGYIRNLTNVLVEQKPIHNQASIIDLCEKSGVFNDGILRDATGKINAYLIGAIPSRTNRNETIPSYISLLGLNGTGKRIIENRLDFVFPFDGSLSSVLAYIPSYSATYSYKNISSVCYSIYMLIASIGELVKTFENQLHLFDDGNIVDRILSNLMDLSQHRQYPVPDFRSGTSITPSREEREAIDDLDDSSEVYNIGNSNDEVNHAVINQIVDWLKNTPKSVVASHVLGKISTRFYSALQHIHNQRPLGMPLGELFHYQIVAFMNAVLIEDVRENMVNSRHLNINNTNFSEKILINNLQKTIELSQVGQDKHLQYSRWMLSCPLLRAYMQLTKEPILWNELNLYCSQSISASVYKGLSLSFNQYKSLNLSDNLNKVMIEGNHRRESEERFNNFSALSKKGNEKKLIDMLKLRYGSLEPLVQVGDRSVMRKRNAILREVLPGLFPHNDQYSVNAKNLRERLRESKLID